LLNLRPIVNKPFGTLSSAASSLVDLTSIPEPRAAAHEEPSDRAISKALMDIPVGLSDSPSNMREAQRRPDWDLWKEACLTEMNTLQENGTIKLATPPPGAKVVQSLVQLRLKRDDQGNPCRRKARFCARGDTYSAGPDVPIFAPTAPWSVVRTMLSLACANSYLVKTFDVAAAFTSVDRTGLPDLWLRAPPGLGYDRSQAFHLKKNLYGFAHSPRAFYDDYAEFIMSISFERCAYDKTLFKRRTDRGVIYMSMYVDDALVVASSESAWTEVLEQIQKKYTLSSVGDAKLHLGLTIDYDLAAGVLTLGNTNYITQLAERYNISLNTKETTPFKHPKTRLYPAEITGEKFVGLLEQQAYRAGVGSLNWLATTNRPDLSFPISQLARYLACPTPTHVDALLHVMKYTVATRERSIQYRRDPIINQSIRTCEDHAEVTRNQLNGFCDADFANDVETRKSHTGFVFLLNYAAVDWKSSQQRLVASSSTESEYLALSHCVKTAQYLRHVLVFLDLPQTEPTPIFEDNAACICLCNSDSHESRVKHLDIHLHNARQHVARGTVTLHYVTTACQAADFLTKAVPPILMTRPTAVIFGSDIKAWDNGTKDMKLPTQRFLVPFAPLAPKVQRAIAGGN